MGKAKMMLRLGAAALVAAGGWTIWSENWLRPAPAIDYSGPIAGWDVTGGSVGGQHFSTLTQITPANVWALKPAWTYHIGVDPTVEPSSPTFEATPITAEGKLFVCSGTGRIAAIDPETGRQIWLHRAEANYSKTYLINCRGVTYHRNEAAPQGSLCRSSIFAGTLDGRMIALDAATGRRCTGFGDHGMLDLKQGLGAQEPGDLAISSAPVIAGNLVVVGGRIPDNMRSTTPAGVVRAFDAVSGKQMWAWNPLPPGMTDAQAAPKGETYVRATPNVWAPMTYDPLTDAVIVPTGNAAPDFYGVDRKGLDYFSSSVVALDAKTGAVRWRFQTVHHDIWDYDVPAQPVLFDMPSPAGPVPAVAQATKQGHIFILDRRTGKPLVPVNEMPVPQAGALPGEQLSPTQPVPANSAYVVRNASLSDSDMWGFTPWDRGKCRDLFRQYRWQGTFTPQSEQGTIVFPSFMGASNWGGISIDPIHKVLIANTTQVAAVVKMIPRATAAKITDPSVPVLPNTGTPYAVTMKPLLSPLGAPCNRPPWGNLIAIDLTTGKRLWTVPLGTSRDMAPFPLWLKLGVPNMGGSVITASGLAFIGATTDNYLRGYDVKTGEVLWRARLPAGGQATPMTYRLTKNGRQFVVIAAGGHKYLGTKTGDSLVAYAWP